MNKRNIKDRKKVVTCHDHIGGVLGEALFHFFLKEKLVHKNEDDKYIITDNGWEELELIGVDVNILNLTKRKKVTVCMGGNCGILYEHIGAHLGALLLSRMIELNWIARTEEHLFELTEQGIAGLEDLGVKMKTLTAVKI